MAGGIQTVQARGLRCFADDQRWNALYRRLRRQIEPRRRLLVAMGRKEFDANANAVAAASDKLCRQRVVGSRVFVAGGQAGPNPAAGPSYSYFWMLDLDRETPIWRVLPTWPGPERFYSVGGSDGESFFLFSGIRCIDDDQGKPKLEYLRDAYRFDPTAEKWERLADLPHPNAAVASPAPYADGGLLLLGQGADGSGLNLPLDQRQPFGREVLRYDVSTRRFDTIGSVPFGLAAVVPTQWGGSIIIASGESGPGVRSPAVWSIRPASLNGIR